MFWNKKEDRKALPDLPYPRTPPGMFSELPRPHPTFPEPEEDSESFEPHALPSFPNAPSHNKFTEAVIKEVVADGEYKQENAILLPPPNEHETSEKAKVVEMEEWYPTQLPTDRGPPSTRITPPNEQSSPPVISDMTRIQETNTPPFQQSDVYIRLEKFRSARRALGDARRKLEEIDALMKKIREVKMREEQELAAWERELVQIKARVDDVSTNIFEKVD